MPWDDRGQRTIIYDPNPCRNIPTHPKLSRKIRESLAGKFRRRHTRRSRWVGKVKLSGSREPRAHTAAPDLVSPGSAIPRSDLIKRREIF